MKKNTGNIQANIPEQVLKREIGLWGAISLVIGMVIGSGVFFKPAIVFRNAGAPGLGILAWVAGGIITIASGLTIAEIAAAYPETGGLFVYLRKLYGEKWAFLLGWVETLIYVPGSVAALAVVFATQATAFIPMNKIQQIILAMFMILLIMIINLISTKLGSRVQLIATIAKLIPIAVIIIFGFLKGTAHDYFPIVGSSGKAAGFGAAMLGTLWAYDGWIGVGNIAGELKNPKKDLPKSIILGLGVVMAVYILINIAIVNVLPMSAVVASKKPASDAAVALFGSFGAAFISAGILISIFGALNGYLMSGVRMPYAMATDDLIPFKGFFSKLSGSKTPVNSLIFESILAMIYATTGSFDLLTNLVVFVLWIFFTMAVYGVFILRSKHKDIERPYKVPLYPIIPIIGIIGGIFIIINTLFTDTANALYGLGVSAIGVPIYLMLEKRKIK